ncbi:ankyrin repeat domain-containing protein, putative [Eimeria acervulina]|uniref:Ankyrin repeat domain-containing protein, putative n=1 Tax=Eimeria acervulina TaxID=5801 RepID=U6GF27_EIMAC|nr:ankyrin repeat domain-containing protein, putative [Eimeria acervulina]CDI77159.1 ankyrin repeat domain-containing protein, putative [Eimeria acervulina]
MHICCHLDIVQLLLQHGADVNGRGFGNQTAIWRAVSTGQRHIVQFLMQVPGVDLNVKETGTGDNLLHLAVNSEYAAIYWDIAEKAPHLEDEKNKEALTPVGCASSSFMKALKFEFELRKNKNEEIKQIDEN